MSSLLEAFYVLFKIDSKSAEKDLHHFDSELEKSEKISTRTAAAVNQTSAAFQKSGSSLRSANAPVSQLDANLKHLDDDVKKTTDDFKKLDIEINKVGHDTKHSGDLIGGAVNHVQRFLVTLLSTGVALATLKTSADFSDEIGQIAQRARVDIESLDAWGEAVKSAGGSADSFHKTVLDLNESFSQVAATGTSENAVYFRQLGVSMTDLNGRARDVLETLPELAQRFQSLSNARQLELGKHLGLDEGTIMLLQRGRVEVEKIVERQKKLGIVTKEDADIARKFNAQWQDTSHTFRSLSVQIASAILPTIQKILESVERFFTFINSHHHLVVGALRAMAIGVGVITAAMVALKIETLLAFAPWIALGAAIAGVIAIFALLYDDYQTFLEGGDSLIGRFLQKFSSFKESLKEDVEEIKSFFSNAFSTIVAFLSNILEKPIEAWRGFKESVSRDLDELIARFPFLGTAIDEIKREFVLAGELILKIWEKIISVIDKVSTGIQKGVTFVKSAASNVFSSNKDDAKPGVSQLTEKVQAAQKIVIAAANTPVSLTSSKEIVTKNETNATNRNVSVQTGEITINTQATDSSQIAADFSDHLKREMRQAVNHFDNGVLA